MNTRTRKTLIAAGVLVLAAFGAAAQEPRAPDYSLDIVSPADQAVVFDDSGDVGVRATVAPGLAGGDQVEFLVDGMPVGPPSAVLEFPLFGIVPGPHLLQARIVDSSGNVGAIAPSTNFYVWQEALRLDAPATANLASGIR